MTTQSDSRFQAMIKEAKDRTLFVSPPYSTEGKRQVFLAGYEAALRDIARGWLISAPPRRWNMADQLTIDGQAGPAVGISVPRR